MRLSRPGPRAVEGAPPLREPARRRYIEGGERAVTRFEEGAPRATSRAPTAGRACSARCRCAAAPPLMGLLRELTVASCGAQYEVSGDQDSVQMLQRSTQIGEFYRMHPPPVWDKSKQLPPTYMDILISTRRPTSTSTSSSRRRSRPPPRPLTMPTLRGSWGRLACHPPASPMLTHSLPTPKLALRAILVGLLAPPSKSRRTLQPP